MNLVSTHNFVQPLSPEWIVYKSKPFCCPDTVWSPTAVAVSNGVLSITTSRQPDGSFIGGGVSMANIRSQTYGRWRVRMRLTGQVKMAVMLWQTGQPPETSGNHAYEIDFAETLDTGDTSDLTSTLHYPPGNQMAHHGVLEDLTQWNTIGVAWKPGELIYTFNGSVWATTVGSFVPDIPMHLALQTTNGLGQTDDASLEIDRIKVWSYTP